uniref:Uncharacterized protein n=1 Tax=Mycena chlorophos TaxID=658473 RepID=A0ABQ0L5I8_MYCCL|nr:predicted protein [Mycena chlorophos]
MEHDEDATFKAETDASWTKMRDRDKHAGADPVFSSSWLASPRDLSKLGLLSAAPFLPAPRPDPSAPPAPNQAKSLHPKQEEKTADQAARTP